MRSSMHPHGGVSTATRRVVAVTSGIATLSMSTVAFATTPSASSTPMPSAIGSEDVSWLAVSPAFNATGLALAVAQGIDCKGPCLWATHDRGSTWSRVSPDGMTVTRAVVGVDGAGRETIFVATADGLQQSGDGGSHWSKAGGSGFPSVGADYASTGRIVVGGVTAGDYQLLGGAAQLVTGSGGSIADLTFMFAPTYPSGGKYAPVLLSGGDKHAGLPLIKKCTTDLICTGPGATLQDASTFSIPVTLLPSSDYANDGVVFAQSGRGIYKSTNGGTTFTAMPVGTAGATATATTMLAVPVDYREHGPDRSAYVAVLQVFHDAANPKQDHTDGGIYKTTDGGVTWSKRGSPSPLDHGATAVALAPDGRLFAGYLNSAGKGLLCSVDGGETWHASCPTSAHNARNGGASGGSMPCAQASCSSSGGGSGSGGQAGSNAGGGGAGGQGGATLGSAAQRNASLSSSSSRTTLLIVAGTIALLLACAAVVRRRLTRRTTGRSDAGA